MSKRDEPETGRITRSDLYRENWEHVRHVENERLGFTSVYIVVVAGVLAFLAQKGVDSPLSRNLLWLLVVLSVIGALISLRLMADMEAHGGRLKALAKDSGLQEFFTFGAESGWTNCIQLRKLFPIAYAVCGLFFLVAAITLPSQSALSNARPLSAATDATQTTEGSSEVPRAVSMENTVKDQGGTP